MIHHLCSCFLLLLTIFGLGCPQLTPTNQQSSADGKHFGQNIEAAGAMPIADLVAQMEQNSTSSLTAKISGKVLEVCQTKGCWMTLELPDGKDLRVTFKDYGFFMPKDLAGKNIVAQGIAQTDTTSVEMLQHYAEDAGKSAEEIAQIAQPEIEISFVADGVVIE